MFQHVFAELLLLALLCRCSLLYLERITDRNPMSQVRGKVGANKVVVPCHFGNAVVDQVCMTQLLILPVTSVSLGSTSLRATSISKQRSAWSRVLSLPLLVTVPSAAHLLTSLVRLKVVLSGKMLRYSRQFLQLLGRPLYRNNMTCFWLLEESVYPTTRCFMQFQHMNFFTP